MFRMLLSIARSGILAIIAVLFCAALLAGCGDSAEDAVTSVPMTTPTQVPKVAASGPAISDTLNFDQLTLDSTVSKEPNKEKTVTYLVFAYTDSDGKVYKCRLPEAMAQGAYPPKEWLRTFAVYRLPKVLKQKKIVKQENQSVEDYPFIAPRPGESATPEQSPTPEPTPSSVPVQPQPSRPPSMSPGT